MKLNEKDRINSNLMTSNVGEVSETNNLNDKLNTFKNLNILKTKEKVTNSLNENKNSSNMEKNRTKDKIKSNKKYLKKIEKNKKLFELPSILVIPIITRACVVSFYNDLKEYQNDLSKKISENILKNQKYLEEIVKDKKSSNYNIKDSSNKKEKKPILPNFSTKQKNDLKNSLVSKVVNEEIKYSKNINEIKMINSIDYEKLETTCDKSVIQNLDKRIHNLEEKMEKLLNMTEKMFNLIQKREILSDSQPESMNESLCQSEENTDRSASTIKIDKYGQINYDDISQ